MHNYKELAPDKIEYVAVAEPSEISDGERLFFQIDDFDIVLLQIAGEYYAVGNICTHDNGPLGDGQVEACAIACPRHGARFDIRTGKVLALPAYEDIPVFPVRVQDGQIEIGLPLGG
jgi:3-phenylpropionate/trans-cinnamate dioxygenase ferredoxin subunit